MSIIERMTRLSNRMYDGMRDRRAFTLRDEDAIEGSLDALRGTSTPCWSPFAATATRYRRRCGSASMIRAERMCARRTTRAR